MIQCYCRRATCTWRCTFSTSCTTIALSRSSTTEPTRHATQSFRTTSPTSEAENTVSASPSRPRLTVSICIVECNALSFSIRYGGCGSPIAVCDREDAGIKKGFRKIVHLHETVVVSVPVVYTQKSDRLGFASYEAKESI